MAAPWYSPIPTNSSPTEPEQGEWTVLVSPSHRATLEMAQGNRKDKSKDKDDKDKPKDEDDEDDEDDDDEDGGKS